MNQADDNMVDEPGEVTKADQLGVKQTRKLPAQLILLVPGYMILQGALGLISLKTGFLSQQSVQLVGPLVFMLIGAPILAIVGWQHLIADSSLRAHWEARLLAVSTVVFILGFDVVGIMTLAGPALAQTAFSYVMLFATLISLALLLCSTLVMLTRVGFSAIEHKRQTRSGDERLSR